MAEIKVEKKKPVWPWILLGLIILGIILYFLFANGDDVDDMDDMNTEQVTDTTYQTTEDTDMDTATWDNDTAAVNSESVNRYITHVGDTQRMGIEHEYTNNALTHLVNAVEYKAREQNVNIDTDLQEIKNEAQNITQNPQATDHANSIKNAGTKIADALEKIQQEKFPDLSQDVQEVRTAAQEIDTATLTLDQKDQINSFFNEAADVLRKMS